MTIKEFINVPFGTKFLMKANDFTQMDEWVFLSDDDDNLLLSKNREYAKKGEYWKVLRKIKNLSNGHTCWISARYKNSCENREDKFWKTRKMHLVD